MISLYAVRIVRPHPRPNPPATPWHAGHWLGPAEEPRMFTSFEIVPTVQQAKIGTRAEADALLREAQAFDADFEIVEFREVSR